MKKHEELRKVSPKFFSEYPAKFSKICHISPAPLIQLLYGYICLKSSLLTYRWQRCQHRSYRRCGYRRRPRLLPSVAAEGHAALSEWAWTTRNCWTSHEPCGSLWSATWVHPPRWASRCCVSSRGCWDPCRRRRWRRGACARACPATGNRH